MQVKNGVSKEQLTRIIGLKQQKQRQRYMQMIVEGPISVAELVKCNNGLIRDIYISKTAKSKYSKIVNLALEKRIYVHEVMEEELALMSTDAQGILAIANQPKESLENLSGIALTDDKNILVATAAINDPGNLGTIIRCADVSGAAGVLISSGSAEIYSPKTIRSSAGSIFHLPTVNEVGLDLEKIVRFAKSIHMQVFFADANGSVTLDKIIAQTKIPSASQNFESGVTDSDEIDNVIGELSIRNPTCWVFGNEAHGFTVQEKKLADAVVSIPIRGRAESINVSAAAAICTYASSYAQNL